MPDEPGDPHGLQAWTASLRAAPAGDGARAALDAIDAIDAAAVDNAVRFSAEHARRYAATGGADDGWQGPRPILLLYTTGRRSGQVRRNPLLYVDLGERRLVIASKGGDPKHPEWYLNLLADPVVHLRVMADVYRAEARPLDDVTHGALWPELVARYPMFADYQARTDRRIPLVELVPFADG